MALAFGGMSLMGFGLYFILLRPPLLPEDTRFMGTSLVTIQASVPGLATWLTHVFWVLGGFMFTTGLLTGHLALSSFRQRARGSATVAALAGLTSIGWMSAVNFLIASDFKWVILAFTFPWALALMLYRVEGNYLRPAGLRGSL
ncbi:MAG: hypothetical protein ABJE95_26075 [Byssovorax sp.]